MALTINFDLIGIGWAKCTIRPARKNYVITASFETHALEDLLQSALSVLDGCAGISFDFHGYAIYTWHIAPQGAGKISVQIRELVVRLPEFDKDMVMVVEFSCSARQFAQAVHDAAMKLLATHGIKAYNASWQEDDFPIKSYNLLKSRLAVPRAAGSPKA